MKIRSEWNGGENPLCEFMIDIGLRQLKNTNLVLMLLNAKKAC